MSLEIIDRYRGCLLGLACGDALGTTLEFKPPGTFTPITDMVGGGPFHLKPGQWTDDTSMAMCLAESLVQSKGFDAKDQMERYTRWWKEGYWSSTGRCFDIGNTTARALGQFGISGDPLSGSTDKWSAANGSIMRLAPVPLFFANDPAKAIELSGESSRTTHRLEICIDACRYLGGLIVGAVKGDTKEALLSTKYCPAGSSWSIPLHEEIDSVAAGSVKSKQPPDIKGTGYVVASLEAALWAFYNSDSFGEGCLMAVNLGDDADTTGAVYGQLAGAYYGESGIPKPWLDKVTMADEIRSLAAGLMEAPCGSA